MGILAEEAVAWMDRLGAGDFGGGDYLGDVQVGLRGRGGADADFLIREAHMQGVAVGL